MLSPKCFSVSVRPSLTSHREELVSTNEIWFKGNILYQNLSNGCVAGRHIQLNMVKEYTGRSDKNFFFTMAEYFFLSKQKETEKTDWLTY